MLPNHAKPLYRSCTIRACGSLIDAKLPLDNPWPSTWRFPMQLQHALRLVPQYQKRVWGGQRLKPSPEPYGEAWLVWEENKVAGGELDGQTLAEVARSHGEALLGRRAMARTGTRFPVLIKLLDCADWLSLQVHPNDEQARRLEGADQFGKTEAWHILEVDPGAE